MQRLHCLVLLYLVSAMNVNAQAFSSSFENCSEYSYGFVHIRDQGKNIPPAYCAVNRFAEGLAAVKTGGKWGYIDVENKKVIPCQFDGARSFKHGLAIVRKGDFYGVINKEGNYIIQPVYYDLASLEVEGQLYYISRDSTFFSGLIDRHGKEVLPHHFTYLIPLEGYDQIPLCSSFQNIDTTKGSFYAQFTENPYKFSPEIGKQTIYNLKFNSLISRSSSSYTDGFQHNELNSINTLLKENHDKSEEKKKKEINRLLSTSTRQDTTVKVNEQYQMYQTKEPDKTTKYLDSLGYILFNDAKGKVGLKKRDDLVVPALYDDLELVNSVILFPLDDEVPYLEEHYAGSYRDKVKGVFDIYCVVARSNAGAMMHLYNLSGRKIFPLEDYKDEHMYTLSGTTSVGFNYLSSTKNKLHQISENEGLINWKGEEILAPIYKHIEVLKPGHLLVRQERQVNEGKQEDVGLYSKTGEVIIPTGDYAEIKPFYQVNGFYLAKLHDSHPMLNDKQKNKDQNRQYVVCQINKDSFRIVNRFTSSFVITHSLDMETGFLQYKKKKED